MQNPVVAGGKTLGFEQRDGERIAEDQLHRRRGGGREAVGTRLLDRGEDERDIRLAPKRAVRARGHGDERDGESLGVGDDIGELRRLSRPRQRQHHVAILQHAEVAVARFGGMDEHRGLAGRGQGRGDLSPDMARLAHAGDDDAARGRVNHLYGLRETHAEAVAQRLLEGGDAGGFEAEGAQGGSNRGRKSLWHGAASITARRRAHPLAAGLSRL